MDWLFTALRFYCFLLALGVVAFPLARRLFPAFVDRGYGFAKTIGILVLSYAMFIAGIVRILPFTQASLVTLIALIILVIILIRRKHESQRLTPQTMMIMFFEEILFLLSFLFLTYIRSQEPSIRGLEKYMDFGFINSILRSQYFPPLDMWLSADPSHPAGYPINYYYFGHLTGALLIKLTNTVPAAGYNLILAAIFGQGIVTAFSLTTQTIYKFGKKLFAALVFGLLGTFIVNLGGNLHTIYLFTKGYSPDNPVPFWNILSVFNPTKYWYPNATRFIPFTIHEFPSYSYVVADLHGHVFDIPFVILTLAILFQFFTSRNDAIPKERENSKINPLLAGIARSRYLPYALLMGFMTAIHYMTNAFDGPIYMLLASLTAFFLLGAGMRFLVFEAIMVIGFLFFSAPFSLNFSPFVSGIGMNCAPAFLTSLKKLGPFIFEAGNCQPDQFWMLWILWGFFWTMFLMFPLIKAFERRTTPHDAHSLHVDDFSFILLSFGSLLVLIPEFFYIKDIYPAHFRANTMFKLGYQAFIMMSIASVFVIYRLRYLSWKIALPLKLITLSALFLVFLYPFFSFPSYYGPLTRKPELDGSVWMTALFPADKQIIDFLNESVTGQPVVLEAQGDSYTDYERISAYTGLPTIAGWWVHEWLWRGSSDVIGKKIPVVMAAYQSPDVAATRELLKAYHVEYVVVSGLERAKYAKLEEEKFLKLGNKILTTDDGFGALYQLNIR